MFMVLELYGLVLVIVFHLSQGEKPLSVCSNKMPFKTINNECTNYNEACTKTDDPDCLLFINACAQCPVSGDTMSSKSKDMKIWVILIVNLLELVIVCSLLMVIKLKCRYRSRQYKNIRDDKDASNSENQLITTKKDLEEKIDTIAGPIEQKMTVEMENLVKSSAIPIYPLTIILPNLVDIITVNVSLLDNAVKIKRHIASQFPNLPDYKLMKLKYNGTILDDNAYLVPLVCFLQAIVFCDVDKKTPAKDYVVLKLHGNRPLPELIQLNKKCSIRDYKQIICKLYNVENVALYKDLVELPDNSTFDNCKLQDDDAIQLITREIYLIKVTDIFDGSRCEDIEITNTSKVAILKESIAKKIKFEPENIILLLADKYLDPSKIIFEYNFSTETIITFFCIKKFTGIQIQGDAVSTGHGSELFIANNKDKEVILKRYEISRVPNLMKYPPLINELRRLQVFQSHPSFVRLHDIYKDDKYLYVEMEKLDTRSMLEYVDENKPIPKPQIVKWLKQILGALKYIHDHGIIHGDIKPSNILFDLELKVKLSGFHLSRFWTPFGVGDAIGSRRFSAPEVLSSLPYNASADVWSFGAVLIFLFTGVIPYSEQKENEAVSTICKTQTIQYDSSGISSDMKVFLGKCLMADPSARPSVDELLMDRLIVRGNQ